MTRSNTATHRVRPRVVHQHVVDRADLDENRLRRGCALLNRHGERGGLVDRATEREAAVVRPRREAGEIPGDGLAGTHGGKLLGLTTDGERTRSTHGVRVGTRCRDDAGLLVLPHTGLGVPTGGRGLGLRLRLTLVPLRLVAGDVGALVVCGRLFLGDSHARGRGGALDLGLVADLEPRPGTDAARGHRLGEGTSLDRLDQCDAHLGATTEPSFRTLATLGDATQLDLQLALAESLRVPGRGLLLELLGVGLAGLHFDALASELGGRLDDLGLVELHGLGVAGGVGAGGREAHQAEDEGHKAQDGEYALGVHDCPPGRSVWRLPRNESRLNATTSRLLRRHDLFGC